MQSEGRLAPGAPRRYPSAFGAYAAIVRAEGVRALWTGLGPNVARNALINAAELASYDQIKESLLASGLFQDNVYCHLASGLGAGLVAVCVGSPVDVVKSRMMGAAPGTYSSVADAFVKTARRDGLRAFYNGFGPNFARLGSWCALRRGPARCIWGPGASVLCPPFLAAHPPPSPPPPPAVGTSQCSSC
jgi:solute carrier family 25 uncoupling protein 8/9